MFEDDFSGVTATQWKPEIGIWQISDGAYTGLRPRKPSDGPGFFSYVSFADFEEPPEFTIRGRFKLDESSHISASIYFRSGSDNEMVVTNQFRHGAWLAVQESGQTADQNVVFTRKWTQDHLAQKRYSFRSGKWYEFELVVTRDAVRYSVEGEIFFEKRLPKRVSPGRIGLGGHWSSPTYFDDIVVSLIDR